MFKVWALQEITDVIVLHSSDVIVRIQRAESTAGNQHEGSGESLRLQRHPAAHLQPGGVDHLLQGQRKSRALNVLGQNQICCIILFSNWGLDL